MLVAPVTTVEAGVGEGERLDVRKTYKLYIGGKFPRTESGRSYLVVDDKGKPWANACRASRKDVRDAVQAARKAVAGWSGATAYNRGQVLYRVAEMLEGRREQFVEEVARAEGVTRRAATETRPLPAITLAEVLATSDLPGGVVNLLTGFAAELVGPLAAHMDVDALDLAGLDLALYREAELAAAENVKRVVPPVKLSARDWLADAKGQDPYWIANFLEIKTVWHPIGV
jgi:acyl-CoA reductase-like NAD-dependent aldehyde dehydrogenase